MKIKKDKNSLKNTPLGIKILSIFYLISSIVYALLGLSLLIIPEKMTTLLFQAMPESVVLEEVLLENFIMVSSISFIVVGIIGAVIAIGLFNLKNWARLTYIFFILLSFFSSLMYLASGAFSYIITFLLTGFISYYLIFDKNVKAAFKNKQ